MTNPYNTFTRLVTTAFAKLQQQENGKTQPILVENNQPILVENNQPILVENNQPILVEDLVNELNHLIRDYNLALLDEDKEALIEISEEIQKVSNTLLLQTKRLSM